MEFVRVILGVKLMDSNGNTKQPSQTHIIDLALGGQIEIYDTDYVVFNPATLHVSSTLRNYLTFTLNRAITQLSSTLFPTHLKVLK